MPRNNADFVFRSLSASLAEDVKRITLDITANLVQDTPVDTGWASANWIASVGVPVIQDLSLIRERPVRAAGVPGALATQKASAASIAAYKGGPTYITNNVPYIIDLNHGTSDQAPPFFVENAIRRALHR